MTYFLGLTGGIATGKSTVSQLFKEVGIPVIDADLIAREVVLPGTPGLNQVVSTFGPELLNADGTLKRQALGDLVFADAVKRQSLNDLLGPLIHAQILSAQERFKKMDFELVVCDIPLLFETDYQTLMDGILVVYVTPNIQLSRLMNRNQLTEKQAKERINSQLPLAQKKEKADFLIDNSKSITETKRQFTQLLDRLKAQ